MSTIYLGEPDKILVHPRFDLKPTIGPAPDYKVDMESFMEAGSGLTFKMELPQLHGEIWQTVDKGSVSTGVRWRDWRWYAVCMHCRVHSNAYKQPNRWTMQWAVRHRCVPTLYLTGQDQ